MENNYYYVHWLLGEDERKITGEKKLKQDETEEKFIEGKEDRKERKNKMGLKER